MPSHWMLYYVQVIYIFAVAQVGICRTHRGIGRDTPRRSVPPIIEPENTYCNEENCNDEPEMSYCGSNGRTYTSACRTRKALCQDLALTFKPGKCPESKACVLYRAHVLKNFKNSNSGYIPMCNNDGTYAPLQCSLGNCWCNEPNGEIAKSDKKKRQAISNIPKCGKRPRHNNKCKTDFDRLSFAYKVRGLLEMGYRLSLEGNSVNIVTTTIADAVRWKMNNFIEDRSDTFMLYREFKTMFQSYKHAVSRSCAKVFPKYCDANKDKRVSEYELLLCMGVIPDSPTITPDELDDKTTSNNTPQSTSRSLNKTPRKDDTVNDPPTPERVTCRESQRQTLQAGKLNVLILECEEKNGIFWKPVQCHFGFCFCVNRDDGKPIFNTAIKASQHAAPNCDISTPRQIPGCNGILKERFLSSVLEILLNEWSQRDRSEFRPEDDLSDATDDEKAARWYFSQTDNNNDGNLSRSENKVFKKLVSKRGVKPRKCLRKFSQHCDRNKNKKISIGEFILCLEVNITKPMLSHRSRPGILIGQLETTDDPAGF